MCVGRVQKSQGQMDKRCRIKSGISYCENWRGSSLVSQRISRLAWVQYRESLEAVVDLLEADG